MTVFTTSKDVYNLQETKILIPTKTNNKNDVQRKTNSSWSETQVRVHVQKSHLYDDCLLLVSASGILCSQFSYYKYVDLLLYNHDSIGSNGCMGG
jgi:hypothetical protein